MLVSLAEPNYDRVSPVCPAKLLTVWHTNGVLVWAGVWSKRADKSVISHFKKWVCGLMLVHHFYCI